MPRCVVVPLPCTRDPGVGVERRAPQCEKGDFHFPGACQGGQWGLVLAASVKRRLAHAGARLPQSNASQQPRRSGFGVERPPS